MRKSRKMTRFDWGVLTLAILAMAFFGVFRVVMG